MHQAATGDRRPSAGWAGGCGHAPCRRGSDCRRQSSSSIGSQVVSSMSSPAIEVCNLSKQYRLGEGGGPAYDTLRDLLTETAKASWRAMLGKGRGATPATEKS